MNYFGQVQQEYQTIYIYVFVYLYALFLQRDAEKNVKKQTKLEIQRAVEQDPTVYQYDEVYDKMEEQKMEKISQKKDMEKKVNLYFIDPKYFY